jgi:hypothetical protein
VEEVAEAETVEQVVVLGVLAVGHLIVVVLQEAQHLVKATLVVQEAVVHLLMELVAVEAQAL